MAVKGRVPEALAIARVATQFKPGNPGRVAGSRNKLGQTFLDVLYIDFQAHGEMAIKNVRENDPSTYMRVVANLLPKELEIKRPLADLTDAELANAVDLIRAAIAGDPGNASGGGSQEDIGKPPRALPSLH